jgi:hypothetical protein
MVIWLSVGPKIVSNMVQIPLAPLQTCDFIGTIMSYLSKLQNTENAQGSGLEQRPESQLLSPYIDLRMIAD